MAVAVDERLDTGQLAFEGFPISEFKATLGAITLLLDAPFKHGEELEIKVKCRVFRSSYEGDSQVVETQVLRPLESEIVRDEEP